MCNLPNTERQPLSTYLLRVFHKFKLLLRCCNLGRTFLFYVSKRFRWRILSFVLVQKKKKKKKNYIKEIGYR